ncbi:MAG: glycerophosphoryl diester phosphodiesterase membrane domain-containing protein [Pseudomonadota bacterium]
MAGAGSSFAIGRVFAGWGWLLNRDVSRLLPFLSIWVAVQFGLFAIDHFMGLNRGLGLLSTTFLVDPFFLGVLYLMALQDDNQGVGALTSVVLSRYLGLLGVYILTSIGIGIGLVLLVLPGLALAVLWAVALPVFLAERKSPTDAIRGSFDYVRPHFWPVLGVLVVFGVTIMTFAFAVTYLGLTSEDGAPNLALLMDALVEVTFAALGAYLNAAIYRELAFSGRHDVGVFD